MATYAAVVTSSAGETETFEADQIDVIDGVVVRCSTYAEGSDRIGDTTALFAIERLVYIWKKA